MWEYKEGLIVSDTMSDYRSSQIKSERCYESPDATERIKQFDIFNTLRDVCFR